MPLHKAQDLVPRVVRGLPAPQATPQKTPMPRMVSEPPAPWDKRFRDFQTLGEKQLCEALAAATQFVDAFRADPYGGGYILTLSGANGCGKTFLAKCTLAEMGWNFNGTVNAPWREAGGAIMDRSCKFRDWTKVADRMLNGNWQACETMNDTLVVCLDDIGANYDKSGAVTAKLNSFLRSRGKRWTIVTSNFTIAQMRDQLDARIASYLIRDKNVAVNLTGVIYFALRKLKPKDKRS